MDSFSDRLSEYLDGELDAHERAAVDRHLAACEDCRLTLDELRGVVDRAGRLHDRMPANDLWTGIAQHLDAKPHGTGVLPFRRVRVPRRFSFTLTQLAAASLTLVVMSGGLVWLARSGDPRADFAPVSATADPADAVAAPGVRPANFADAHYDEAIADLQRTLTSGRETLDAETVRILEDNLDAIDRAIDQCRQALAKDPANLYLNSHLAEARQRKLALLRRATALASLAGT
jgi:tetratricopeptide (TPR) repeat protein